jgi:hypothetical protein
VRSSTKIFCNSVDSDFMFAWRTLVILASRAFLSLVVNVFFKVFPPILLSDDLDQDI